MTFALDLSRLCEKAKDDIEFATRKVMIELFSKVVLKSPVGNKELWAANAHAIYMRETHNLFVDRINEDLYNVPENLTKRGNLKKGINKEKRLGKKALKETYKLKAGKDYVGGRFRANWVVGYKSIDESTYDEVDKSGNKTIGKITSEVISAELGDGSIFLTNSLPYAHRLENGWSKQAPAGMVRLSMVEITNHYGA